MNKEHILWVVLLSLATITSAQIVESTESPLHIHGRKGSKRYADGCIMPEHIEHLKVQDNTTLGGIVAWNDVTDVSSLNISRLISEENGSVDRQFAVLFYFSTHQISQLFYSELRLTAPSFPCIPIYAVECTPLSTKEFVAYYLSPALPQLAYFRGGKLIESMSDKPNGTNVRQFLAKRSTVVPLQPLEGVESIVFYYKTAQVGQLTAYFHHFY
eukprot:TRINITY_DN9369_c0_g1_i2.p1 TRINITY_DN9369_c0_g1~~TRINITY_DN9369_c0_g1_i2.p1  ORF type:complete len:214 (+),score=31.16 TRINITY_DN9369_c0_g1_i2:43-684(+)